MGEATLADRLSRIRRGFSGTPVIPLDHERLDLFTKLEFSNSSGSVKDRSAYVILQRAVERGEITASSIVVESSSGNFAIALAALCRLLGLPFVPVIDPNVNTATEVFLRTACRRVEKVSEPDTHGGYLRTRLARVEELTSSLDDAFWPNQYTNTDAADAHDVLTGAEICHAFDRLDYLFIGVGTGATIAGVSRRVKRLMPRTKVIAVDSAGSAIFGGPARRRHIPGIGSSIRPPLLEQATIDDVVIVEEGETVAACHRLVERFGLFVGGSTGSVYAAIEQYFAGYRGPRPTIMFLCADRGTAYADTVYRPGWLTAVAEPVPAP